MRKLFINVSANFKSLKTIIKNVFNILKQMIKNMLYLPQEKTERA